MAFSFSEFDQNAQKAVEHTLTQVNALRIGGASVQMLDPIQVNAYGTQMKLNEVANLSAPDPQTLMITPWDASLVREIEKAIQIADLNMNPIVDGKIIRISVPPLTQETRQEMVKILSQKIEDGKTMIRSIRSDAKKDIEKMEGQDGVSEDDIESDLEALDKKTKDYVSELEDLYKQKEERLLKI